MSKAYMRHSLEKFTARNRTANEEQAMGALLTPARRIRPDPWAAAAAGL